MRERLIKLIQEAVPGCATHWAGLIVDRLIENGLIAPQWISVKDRLPEAGENVIACDKEKAVCEAILSKDGKFYWSGFWGDWCDVLEATNWMPLPEPPKEEAATDIPKELNPSQ